MTESVKIIRGYYLTGLGQEPLAYYFKLSSKRSEYHTLTAGDIAITFYQNGEAITSIPALIRVDAVIDGEKQIMEFLQSEKKDHVPMLPLISVYDGFDPLQFNQITEAFKELKVKLQRLIGVSYIQGDLFEFAEEGEEDNE